MTENGTMKRQASILTLVAIIAALFTGCAGQQGTTTTPVTTTAVGEAGRDAGTAAATESGAATTNFTVVPIIGAKTVTIDGRAVQVEGQPDASVSIRNMGTLAHVTITGDENATSGNQSGGGAAGGTGGAARSTASGGGTGGNTSGATGGGN